MVSFSRTTVLLPVISETQSLKQTVEILLDENKSDLQEILIVTGKKTTVESLQVCQELVKRHGPICRVVEQRLPFLGGAMRDAFGEAKGSHTIMMASDLETDPHTVKNLILEAKNNPDWIITTSRWIESGSFNGYSGQIGRAHV